MSQTISLWGAVYSNVPGIDLPKSPSGTARFTDVSDSTASAADVSNSAYFYTSSGVRTQGSLSFVTYYTGSGTPSSSLGSNGDIYLKTS